MSAEIKLTRLHNLRRNFITTSNQTSCKENSELQK